MNENQAINLSKKVVSFLHMRREEGSIDVTIAEVNDYVESIGIVANGGWDYFVNKRTHNKLPKGILIQLDMLRD